MLYVIESLYKWRSNLLKNGCPLPQKIINIIKVIKKLQVIYNLKNGKTEKRFYIIGYPENVQESRLFTLIFSC